MDFGLLYDNDLSVYTYEDNGGISGSAMSYYFGHE